MTKKHCYNNVFVCDFETLHEDTHYFKNLETKDTRILLWYAKNINENKDIGGDEYIGIDGSSWFNWIKSLKQNTTIFFHNTAFDGEFIIPILNDMGLKCNDNHYNSDTDTLTLNRGYRVHNRGKSKEKFELKANHYTYFRSSGKIYNILIHFKNSHKNGYDFFVQIRCSLMMLSNPISKLAEAYETNTFLNQKLVKMFENEKQLGNDFYKVEPVADLKEMDINFVNYCKRDVEIARRSLIDFEKAINTLPSIKQYLEDYNKKFAKHYKKKNRKWTKLDSLKIYQKALTIAGLGRYLMKNIYVPKFQKSNERYYKNNVFKHNQTKYGSFLLINEKTYDFINSKNSKFYYGAFTQFNPFYQTTKENKDKLKLENGIKLDVVSAYPYQMTKSLPFGEILEEDIFFEYYLKENPDWKQGIDYIAFLTIKVKSVVPKEIALSCPVLRNWDKKQVINKTATRYINQPIFDFEMRVIQDEWEELQHWGEFEVESMQKNYMLSAPYLKDYAEEVIAMKTKYGIEKNASFKQAMKILANSAYGGLGMRKEFDNYIFMDDSSKDFIDKVEKDQEVNVVNIINEKQTSVKFSGISPSKDNYDLKCVRIKPPINKQWFYNVAAASTITALQRVYIWKTIRTIGPKYFAYSDTDSIIFVNYDKQAEEKIKSIIGSNLGQWESEKDNLVSLTIRKAKDYAVGYLDQQGNLVIDSKVAGFDKHTDLQDLIEKYHNMESDDYLQDRLDIKFASLKKVKYKHGLILTSIDKINSTGTI